MKAGSRRRTQVPRRRKGDETGVKTSSALLLTLQITQTQNTDPIRPFFRRFGYPPSWGVSSEIDLGRASPTSTKGYNETVAAYRSKYSEVAGTPETALINRTSSDLLRLNVRRRCPAQPVDATLYPRWKDGVYSVIFEESRLSVPSHAHLNKWYVSSTNGHVKPWELKRQQKDLMQVLRRRVETTSLL